MIDFDNDDIDFMTDEGYDRQDNDFAMVGDNEAPITASECIRRLNSQLTAGQLTELTRKGKITPAFFSKLVSGDQIPFTFVVGTSKKMYEWDKVARVMRVPTLAERDRVEREAREAKGYGKADAEFMDEGIDEVPIPPTIFEQYQAELIDELAECMSPTERVSVTEKFWSAKFREFKIRTQMGTYIEVTMVQQVLDAALPSVRDALYRIPPNIAQKYPTVDPMIVEEIHHQVTMALTNLQITLGANPNLTPLEAEIVKDSSDE